MHHHFIPHPHERGQGLVEYALLLVLVALVVVVILSASGTSLQNLFCRVVTGLNGEAPAGCVTDTVEIYRADYDEDDEELHLDARSDGGYNPEVTLTAAPGGVMQARSDHYHLRSELSGCPCTVTVTSSAGGSDSVVVG
jgi:pilus assembly protein Flp/PilA